MSPRTLQGFIISILQMRKWAQNLSTLSQAMRTRWQKPEQHLHIRDQAVGREQRKLEEHAAHLSWSVIDEMKPASQKYVSLVFQGLVSERHYSAFTMWCTRMFALASLALESL